MIKQTKLLLILPFYYLMLNNWTPVQAQIAPDGSLSTNVITTDNLNFTIEQGNRAGNNLFHSFREFSVPTGGEAFFNNAGDIQNIFSRITGGSISNIDGLIRANGTANLFLLNPSGIIFGPNARLNIGGSFFASTASSLIFSDGTQFSATNTQAPPLLTINVPVGLQYSSKAGEIRVQGKGQDYANGGVPLPYTPEFNPLQVNPGNTLAIIGGNVIIDGGIIQAPGGILEIGGLTGEGTIGINQDGSLSFPAGVQRSDVTITNKAGINVVDLVGGSLTIQAQNLEISSSLLTGGIDTAGGFVGARAGDINLDATGNITISGSIINNFVNGGNESLPEPIPAARGDGGNINIRAGLDFVADGGEISTGTYGNGNGGTLTIEAASVWLKDGANLFNQTAGIGNAGNVIINARDNVSISNSKITSDIIERGKGSGNGGDVFVTANGFISIFKSEINSEVQSENSTGNGGYIVLKGDSIFISDNSLPSLATTNKGSGNPGHIFLSATDKVAIARTIIASDTEGVGNAGNIHIQANNSVEIDSSDLSSQVNIGSIGNSGIVEIKAGSVSISNLSQLRTNILDGQGNAGYISILASDQVLISGSTLESHADKAAKGNAGNIEVKAGEIAIEQAFLQNSNYVGGNAGNIFLEASDRLSIINSTIYSDTFNNDIRTGGGLAGTISFTAGNSVDIVNSSITAESLGNAKGNNQNSGLGIIELNAKDVTIERSEFSTNTWGASAAGSININADSLSIINASSLKSSSFGTGNSGSVSVKANGNVAIDNSSLLTNAASFEGNAGNIAIAAQSMQLTNNATLQSSNFLGGNAGNIIVEAKENISLSNSNIFSDTFNEFKDQAGGFAGNILLKAGNSLALDQSSQITAESLSKQQTDFNQNPSGLGYISIDAKAISLSDLSRLSTSTYGLGAGGNIHIQTQTLFVTSGSAIQAITYGLGNAGNIEVNASDSITLSGVAPLPLNEQGNILLDESENILGGYSSGLFADTNKSDSGFGGNIFVNTNNLQIADGAVIAATTRSIEKGGSIAVAVNNLSLTGGGQMVASAFNSGSAGSIRVIAKDRMTISGSDPTYQQRFDTITQQFNQELAESIVTQDGPASGFFVNNRGAGKGGDINAYSPYITVDKGAAITAETASGNGGNISLEAPSLIVLRRNSNISTTAGQSGAGGDGGNITIVTPNLVALENSDITANAFEGKGGRVSITAQSIFGAQARTEETPKSDITAISQLGGPELSGTVELNTPDVDPSSGLIELPQTVVDITGLIDRRCSPTAQESTFVATGRGGLPPSPNEPLNENAYLVDLVNINGGREESRRAGEQMSRGEASKITEIVEAQGWIINDKGQVVLVANPPTVTPHSSRIIPIECYVR